MYHIMIIYAKSRTEDEFSGRVQKAISCSCRSDGIHLICIGNKNGFLFKYNPLSISILKRSTISRFHVEPPFKFKLHKNIILRVMESENDFLRNERSTLLSLLLDRFYHFIYLFLILFIYTA